MYKVRDDLTTYEHKVNVPWPHAFTDGHSDPNEVLRPWLEEKVGRQNEHWNWDISTNMGLDVYFISLQAACAFEYEFDRCRHGHIVELYLWATEDARTLLEEVEDWLTDTLGEDSQRKDWSWYVKGENLSMQFIDLEHALHFKLRFSHYLANADQNQV